MPAAGHACEQCTPTGCEAELRQLLHQQGELVKWRLVAGIAIVAAVLLLLLLLAQLFCLVRCCASRQPAPGFTPRPSPLRQNGRLDGHQEILALLAQHEVRR